MRLLEVFDVEDLVERVGFVGLDGFWFGLRWLEVFDVEDFVERVGVVGLDGFWVACEFFDLESPGKGDSVFVRSGDVEGGVMMAVSRERWCFEKSSVSF